MTTEEVQKDGGSDPRAKLPWPSAARQDDGAATLDRSAAQDGKRGLCQPTGATFRANTGSEETCGGKVMAARCQELLTDPFSQHRCP